MNEKSSAPATPPSAPPAIPPPPGKGKLIGLLLVACVALAAVVWLLVMKRPKGREVIVEVVEEVVEQPVYTSEVIDAIKERNIKAEVGHRYKVVIEDESKEGTAGIARIGGLVTFVKEARVGDILVIEVTRMKQTTAEARIVRKIETAEPVTPAARREPRPRDREEFGGEPVQVGQTYSGTVDEIGSKGDGIVRVGRKVVFVAGTKQGDTVTFRVTADKGRFAIGEKISSDAAPAAEAPAAEEPVMAAEPEAAAATIEPAVMAEPAAVAAAPASQVRNAATSSSEDVEVGRIFDVVVSEQDKKTPDVNGVARIGGLVVFVPNSQPGDQRRIRITDRKARFAFSEIVESDGSAE